MQRLMLVYFKLQCLRDILLACFVVLLSSCSGGGDSASPSNPSSAAASSSSSQILSSSSSSASSVIETVNLNGILTYDYVPHNLNHIGLNYSATEQRPIRGALVEIIDSFGQVKATTNSTAEGTFSLAVQKNINVRVRVKAQLFKSTSPGWNFKVTDNTSNNALYVLDGSLISTGSTDSTRTLNASSGWGGSNYATKRAAAPFAILDDIYIGVNRVFAAGNTQSLSPLELHWSTKNSAAEGDYDKGEIGTSFYDGSAIYILGDEDSDTDEYDPHVLLHEWGHYLEDELFRSDSLGGEHRDGQFLDIRVAMSEGFANAFSGMMTDDNNYVDASDLGQSSGFFFNIARKNRPNKGYFSEGSIGSIFYNFYISNIDKTANDFTPIFKVLSHVSYYANDALTSIYLFNAQLKMLFPEHSSLLESLMQEQQIFGTDEYGAGEFNNGGLAVELPIYKSLSTDNIPTNVCSDAEYGEQNKLGNSQFLRLTISQAGSYRISLLKAGGDLVTSSPEFVLHFKGDRVIEAENLVDNEVSKNIVLVNGNYILEVYDLNNHDNENTEAKSLTCFDVRVTAN